MSDDVKRMDIKEFQDAGYLQEVNRMFFHPLGLALEVARNDEDGSMTLSGVRDNRDDPEGMIFDDFDPLKSARISGERIAKIEARKVLGCCNEVGVQVKQYFPEGS